MDSVDTMQKKMVLYWKSNEVVLHLITMQVQPMHQGYVIIARLEEANKMEGKDKNRYEEST